MITKKNKKFIIAFIVFILIVLIIAINSVFTIIETKNKEKYFSMQGIYLLDKQSTPLNLDSENLDESESYLVAIFDISNKTDKNWERPLYDTVLKINDNSYEGEVNNCGRIATEFIENSGYETIYIEKINAHTTKRIAVTFVINIADITSDMVAELNCDGVSMKFNISDIKSFKLFDDILIDANGEDYQVARSVIKRVDFAYKTCNETILTAYINEKYNTATAKNEKVSEYIQVRLESVKALIDSDFGISITSLDGSSSGEGAHNPAKNLPNYNVERVRKVYPEVADLLDKYNENVKALVPYNSKVVNVEKIIDENKTIIEDIEEFYKN